MPCCKKDKEENVHIARIREHGVMGDRNCTDWLMIVVFIIFVIGWIIILSVAVANGKPDRIIRPNNFRDEICGDDEHVVDLENLWIPRASRLSYGLCVPRCPAVGDIVCNNDLEPPYNTSQHTEARIPNHYYSHTEAEYRKGQHAANLCTLRPSDCNGDMRRLADRFFGMLSRLAQYKCFTNWYASGATLYRCLPFQDERDNATLATLVGDSSQELSELADFLGVGAFFNRGFSEVDQTRWVILISAVTCCFVSLVWIFLLRWIMKPLVYLCIVLILALLILIGFAAKSMADDLEKVKLPGDTATEDQVRLWRAVQYIAWLLAAAYVVVMAWMIKRIKIAIAIMREASHTFLESPGLIVVPPIVFVLFVGWVAFFIVTTIYIQTMGELKEGVFEQAARDTFGDAFVNATLSGMNTTRTVLSENDINNGTINTTEWSQDEKVKALHAYNFFGFLWMSTLCIMFGFFVIAMTGVAYYFSASQDEMALAEDGADEENGGVEKHTEYYTIPRAFWIGFRYHFGTILFGSLLIAIIQFVRGLFLYFKEQFLEEWQSSATISCIIRCIEYCLWYIQKVVEIISKNAFIVCCALNTNFWNSAGTAMSLIGGNAARVGILATLAAVACFVLKLFIVGSNMVIAYLLLQTEALTMDRPVESGLFPMIGILIMSFIIASVFVNVYESLVDTTLMSFLIDEEYMEAEYMPRELAELTDAFKGVEEARREYEKRMREAVDPEVKKVDEGKKGKKE